MDKEAKTEKKMIIFRDIVGIWLVYDGKQIKKICCLTIVVCAIL